MSSSASKLLGERGVFPGSRRPLASGNFGGRTGVWGSACADLREPRAGCTRNASPRLEDAARVDVYVQAGATTPSKTSGQLHWNLPPRLRLGLPP